MPIIHVNMIEGRTEEQKRKVVEGFAAVLEKEANVKKEAIRVIFNDVSKDNLGVGDKLFKD